MLFIRNKLPQCLKYIGVNHIHDFSNKFYNLYRAISIVKENLNKRSYPGSKWVQSHGKEQTN